MSSPLSHLVACGLLCAMAALSTLRANKTARGANPMMMMRRMMMMMLMPHMMPGMMSGMRSDGRNDATNDVAICRGIG